MSTQENKIALEEKPWFYEKNGQRIGGVSQNEIIELINTQTLSYGSSVWKAGFPEWMKIENTELRTHLEASIPPPLLGDNVNNSIVWVLAFAPAIGLVLEYFVAGIANPSSQDLVNEAVANGDYWYITFILNIALCIWDAKRLKNAGTDTKTFRGWSLFVPVYLFQRAKALKQNKAYFIVWMICFMFSILEPME